MAISTIKAVFSSDIHKVWHVVTTVEGYQWRSDLSKAEMLNETQFVEYTKDGYATTFTVTACEPYKRWEFDLKNDNMTGHWTGLFTQKGEKTELSFTEDVTVRKFFMKPFVKAFLKKQQAAFLRDLSKELGKDYELY